MNRMRRRLLALGLCTVLGGPLQAAEAPDKPAGIRDLSYGQALYDFFQDHYFSAITRIMAARDRQRLDPQDKEANLLLGDLYYDFGLIPDAARLFDRLLDDQSPEGLKNQVWFNLARVEYEQGHYRNAAILLLRLQGRLKGERQAQKDYLLLKLHLLAGNISLAREVVQNIRRDSIWRDYGEYNIGVALIAREHYKGARSWLLSVADRSGPINTPERQALSDAARLAAGLAALRQSRWGQAIDALRLVHIDGPLSNTALLASAWAWHHQGNPLQAVGMLQRIIDKKQSDAATREAFVALGQIQEQSGDIKLAAWYYKRAADYLKEALADLGRAITIVRSGHLIQTLVDQGLIHTHGRDSLKRTPHSPATPYLIEALASDRFQRQLRNLQQLVNMRDRLLEWQDKIPAYELMLRERRRRFEARRPVIEQSAAPGRLDGLQARRQQLADAIGRIGREQDARALASERERDQLDRLDAIGARIGQLRGQPGLEAIETRYRLLKGLLTWDLETSFPRRYWAAQNELRHLDQALDKTARSARSLQTASQRQHARLNDLSRRIDGQQQRIAELLQATRALIEQQRQALDEQLIEQLRAWRQHALQLHLSAHYSVARLYDKLTEKPKKKTGGAR